MATPQVKDIVLRSPAGSTEVLTFTWPLQVGTGQDKHDNGIDIIDTIKFVCDELPGISSAFEEINLNHVDTACYKTMTNLVERFNKAVDSIVQLEKGTSLPAERLNKFAHPSLLRHILQLVYNAAVIEPDKLNNYEPFSPEVYGETSYELVQQMIKHVQVTPEDTFIDLGSGVGQVVLQMAGSFPLRACVGIEKADTPVRYAERMDMFFRQFMAWFGKRYCDYKLMKGDFLVDEHRENITASSLVFVNNFAFGPTVDHQLKERFADLRDGARIVSSKSFCPLNFRITDRNLSDIGTIMHLSEIPPLKGSVSWTCKPVSYYLHVIDRTILERYFQRMKTQKGSENDHISGSARTTRDRAKREASGGSAANNNNNNHNNHHALSNHNSNSNSTNTPANVLAQHNHNSSNSNNNNNNSSHHHHQQHSSTGSSNNNTNTVNHNHHHSQYNHHSTTTTTSMATSKTRQQQQQQQQQQLQQQRSMDMDSSTESEGEATTTTTTSTSAASQNGPNSIASSSSMANGPTTRKVWSDWTKNIGKTSPSEEDGEEEEERSRASSRSAVRAASAASNSTMTAGGGQRKRKKLTRKAAVAVASKNAATQRATQREETISTASSPPKDEVLSSTTTTGKGGGRKGGRLKKGATGRGRKSLKIIGLDALHQETLLSTSAEVLCKKLPPAPGCVDQQLTALLTGNMSHTELQIPEAPQDTPYALQILLDVFRSQYMALIERMRSDPFIPELRKKIQLEQERKQREEIIHL